MLNILKLAKEEATCFLRMKIPYLISQQLSNRPDVIITDGGNPYLLGMSMDFGESTDTPKFTTNYRHYWCRAIHFLAGFISKLISPGYPFK